MLGGGGDFCLGLKIELAQKFMQVEVDVKCMQSNLVGMASLVLEISLLFVCLKKWPKFPWTVAHGRVGAKYFGTYT